MIRQTACDDLFFASRGNKLPHPFERLSPDFVLDAIESQGFSCDGRLLALNSYENRVYQVGIEEAEPLVAKFYRPDRWTDEQIAEEHEFSFQLADAEIPVVAPLILNGGESLANFAGFRFSLFPRKGGRTPDIDDLDNLLILGRLLGRMHAIGAISAFQYRPQIDVESFGHQAVTFILENWIPNELQDAYESLSVHVLETIDGIFAQATDIKRIRVHGDCHSGNILWRDDSPHFVDLDDARNAPAVQDIWMLLSGDRERQTAQLSEIIEGYEEFHTFDLRELKLIEGLRTLRLLNYNAWIASRWDDPAFPRAFPWFNTPRYWEQHILDLREQFAAIQEQPLQVGAV
ncbi:MAG: serine/threonine protein kinase [Gammaproteobacteria bacterium]